MTLDPADLNDLDESILTYLGDAGRASPTLFKRATEASQSRQYVSSRFVRLAEHGHIRELHDTGIYELVDDPRADWTQTLTPMVKWVQQKHDLPMGTTNNLISGVELIRKRAPEGVAEFLVADLVRWFDERVDGQSGPKMEYTRREAERLLEETNEDS